MKEKYSNGAIFLLYSCLCTAIGGVMTARTAGLHTGAVLHHCGAFVNVWRLNMPAILICQYEPCSQPFTVPNTRKDKALYCSNRCRARVKRAVLTIECQFCHKPFEINVCQKETARFCSNICRYD